MEAIKNFISLFLEVWNKGILGIDILQISIGLGIFLIFLLFRVLIVKINIQRLEIHNRVLIYQISIFIISYLIPLLGL